MARTPDCRTRVTNVLVIGAGGGGLRAVIAAHQAGVEVLVKELALPVLHDLRTTMSTGCGVLRSDDGLESAARTLDELEARLGAVDGGGSAMGWNALARSVALRAAVLVVRATVLGAREHTESRGAHQRDDHHTTWDQRVALEVRLETTGTLSIEQREIRAPSDWGSGLTRDGSLVDAQRLLE